MLYKLKKLYNKWLFKKYDFNRGPLFEKIPLKYKLNPLFSPSVYANCEQDQIIEWFMEGLEEGKQMPNFKEVLEQIQKEEE